jgi:hypothetical protein
MEREVSAPTSSSSLISLPSSFFRREGMKGFVARGE